MHQNFHASIQKLLLLWLLIAGEYFNTVTGCVMYNGNSFMNDTNWTTGINKTQSLLYPNAV